MIGLINAENLKKKLLRLNNSDISPPPNKSLLDIMYYIKLHIILQLKSHDSIKTESAISNKLHVTKHFAVNY